MSKKKKEDTRIHTYLYSSEYDRYYCLSPPISHKINYTVRVD